MIESTIVDVSEVLVDDNGYNYVDLVFENGDEGFYPNTIEVLSTFTVGSKVRYSSMKHFAGRNKINGLIKKKDKMENGIVKSVGQIQEGNGKYFVEIGLRGGEKAMAIADTIEEISSYRRYDRVRYSGVVTKKEVKIFVNMSNDGTSDSDARQLSITRQSCLKAAIETANISSPKGRWVDKDGVIDWGVAAKEIIAGAELYMDYVNLEDLYN